MPITSTDPPLSVRDHIRRLVIRAADEAWSLGELAEALGKSKQTAAGYVEEFGMEITRSAIRRPRGSVR